VKTPLPANTCGILITDFDGTITTCDYFELVQARWPQSPDPWHLARAGEIPMAEALRRIFAGARGSEEEFLALSEQAGVGPEVGEAFRRLVREGWHLVVASAGCDFYIRHILAQAGVDATVIAHRGTFEEGRGLIMEPWHDPAYAHPRFGLDKAAVVRHFLATGLPVYFAGDGTPDLDPLLALPPERRFATGWVADQLTQRGEGFQRFNRWPDIAAALLA
jgi:HAD superfamily phosphoserine phosphatase-like hydrolase